MNKYLVTWVYGVSLDLLADNIIKALEKAVEYTGDPNNIIEVKKI